MLAAGPTRINPRGDEGFAGDSDSEYRPRIREAKTVDDEQGLFQLHTLPRFNVATMSRKNLDDPNNATRRHKRASLIEQFPVPPGRRGPIGDLNARLSTDTSRTNLISRLL